MIFEDIHKANICCIVSRIVELVGQGIMYFNVEGCTELMDAVGFDLTRTCLIHLHFNLFLGYLISLSSAAGLKPQARIAADSRKNLPRNASSKCDVRAE